MTDHFLPSRLKQGFVGIFFPAFFPPTRNETPFKNAKDREDGVPGNKLTSAHNNKLDNFNSSEEICVAHGVRGRFISPVFRRSQAKNGRND